MSLSADSVKVKVETAKNLLIHEFELERSHHQRLVKEHARLQQRLENLQGEMQVGSSPCGYLWRFWSRVAFLDTGREAGADLALWLPVALLV